MSFLTLENAVLGFGGVPQAVEPLSFSLPHGKVAALIGRNGAGKTTLLRAILGERVLVSGDIRIGREQTSVRRMGPADFARSVAFVPQEHIYPPELVLRDMLALAFLPRLGMFARPTAEHEAELD